MHVSGSCLCAPAEQEPSVRLVPWAGTRGPKHFEQKTFSPEFLLSFAMRIFFGL